MSPAVDAQFDPDEASFFVVPGSATISGQAFVTVRKTTQYSPRYPVRLVPSTSFSRGWIAAQFDNKKQGGYVSLAGLPSDDLKQFVTYTRVTQMDGQGRFSFTSVPDGDYFIIADVAFRLTGQLTKRKIYEAVSIKEGQDVEVTLGSEWRWF